MLTNRKEYDEKLEKASGFSIDFIQKPKAKKKNNYVDTIHPMSCKLPR